MENGSKDIIDPKALCRSLGRYFASPVGLIKPGKKPYELSLIT
jgi:hypothetical protein